MKQTNNLPLMMVAMALASFTLALQIYTAMENRKMYKQLKNENNET